MIYQPAEDSILLQEQVRKYSLNKSVLDIGSGSGIQAEKAILAGAKSILATDIDEESLKFLKGKRIPCLKSNLFENVFGKFDLIIFNPPYLPEDSREDKESAIVTSGGKKGDEIILMFLKESVNHLKKDGIILVVFSSLTPKKRILSAISKLHLEYKVLASKKLFMEELQVWEIKEEK